MNIQEKINKLTEEINSIEAEIKNKSDKTDIKYINELDKKRATLQTRLFVLTSYLNF